MQNVARHLCGRKYLIVLPYKELKKLKSMLQKARRKQERLKL